MRLDATPSRNEGSCARMLAAVATASPGTTNLPPTNMANPPVRKVINQKNPAVLALKRGDVSAIRPIVTAELMLIFFKRGNCSRIACESDRFTITAQPDRCGEKRRGECQPNPETRRAQEFRRIECHQRMDRGATRRREVETLRTRQAVPQYGGDIRSVKRNLLDDLDRHYRQHSP